MHSDCDVGLDRARMIGLCGVLQKRCKLLLISDQYTRKQQFVIVKITSLNEEMASITSCVNVCPFPDVPISTVGLIA